jgi:hypothetical protein
MRTRRPTRAVLGVLLLSSIALAGCAGAAAASSGRVRAGVQPHAASTVWLCRPGLAKDPCTSSLSVTSVPATGSRIITNVKDAKKPAFDCFYIYPTVSTESSQNSDLKVQAAETDVAIDQAAPFSQDCRVYAPMYRQVTLTALEEGHAVSKPLLTTAFNSLLTGWTYYLRHYNDGRPIVFLGHSQGAAMLIRLLAAKVDTNVTLRSKLVSAIILGGNVAVPTGKVVGSTFQHLPLCTKVAQTGCIIAYSSFPSQPPGDALFGRPGTGVSLQSGQTATVGVQVACVNPAAIGGGTAALAPWFLTATSTPPPPAVTTPWVTYPGLYTATCKSGGGATWLQVTDVAKSGDTRPVVSEQDGAAWGYHVSDVNLALANLVADVRVQEAAYTAAHS